MTKSIDWTKPTSDAVEASAMIGDLAKRGARWQDHAQIALISCALVSVIHGNCEPASQMVARLAAEASGSDRTSAMGKWLHDYAPMTYGKRKDGSKGFLLNKDKRKQAKDAYDANPEAFIEALCDHPPYWKKETARKIGDYSLIAVLEAAEAKALRLKDGNVPDGINPDTIDLRGLTMLSDFIVTLKNAVKVGRADRVKPAQDITPEPVTIDGEAEEIAEPEQIGNAA